ncbi:hypothetical protein ACFQL1_16420 [Halomicroarcula sp. GCM10025709]|uniref:hypothetical protein n=1 Tax=Halomicroarcula sp. GCM10025709 TaxID=3252669 RepID=UPI003612A748
MATVMNVQFRTNATVTAQAAAGSPTSGAATELNPAGGWPACWRPTPATVRKRVQREVDEVDDHEREQLPGGRRQRVAVGAPLERDEAPRPDDCVEGRPDDRHDTPHDHT